MLPGQVWAEKGKPVRFLGVVGYSASQFQDEYSRDNRRSYHIIVINIVIAGLKNLNFWIDRIVSCHNSFARTFDLRTLL